MVIALGSGSSGPSSSLAENTALCSCETTQVYKRVPANLLLGGNPAMD